MLPAVNVVNVWRSISSILQSQFVRNVATVATGIFAAQVISLAFTPFLTRLYGPEAFGVVGAFVAVLTILNPTVTLGFSTAIVLPSTEEGATAVARLSIFCAAFVAPAALVFIWVFESHLASWANLHSASYLLYLIPLSLVFTALLAVAEQMAIREGFFKARAISKVSSTLLINIGKLVAGLLAPSGLVLIAITVIGTVLNYFMLLARVPHRGAFQVKRWFGASGILEAVKMHRDFAFYRLPQSVINAAALGLPVLLLAAFFGAGTAGQYSLTSLVLGAPVMLLGKSVSDVFYPKITREISDGKQNAAKLLGKATSVSSLLAVGLFGPLAVVAPYLFPVVFGAEWIQAGLYAQWVSIWMAGVIASRPSVAAYPALGLQKHLLFYEVVVTAARVVVLYVGARYWDDLTAIAAFSVINALGYMALVGLAFLRLRHP